MVNIEKLDDVLYKSFMETQDLEIIMKYGLK